MSPATSIPAEPWPIRSIERVELLKIVAVVDGCGAAMVREVVLLVTPDGELLLRHDPAGTRFSYASAVPLLKNYEPEVGL